MIVNVLLTAFSALLGAVAIPNDIPGLTGGVGPLAFFALVPLLLALLRTKEPKKVIVLALIYALINTPIQIYWLFFFKDYTYLTVGGATLAMFGFFALWFPLYWYALHASPKSYRFLIFGALWTLYEFWKSNGFLGFPWGLIAYPLYEHKVLFQSAQWFGIYFFTFLLASSQALIGEIWGHSQQSLFRKPLSDPLNFFKTKSFWGASGLLAGLWVFHVVFGLISYYSPIIMKDPVEIDVVLVQQNMDSWNRDMRAKAIETSMKWTDRLIPPEKPHPDLIVWSEQSLYWPFDNLRDWRYTYRTTPALRPLPEFVQEYQSQYVFGGNYIYYHPRENLEEESRRDVHNSALVVDSRGQFLGYYTKNQMVPFVELIPLFHWPVFNSFYRSIGLGGSFSPGQGVNLFSFTTSSGAVLQYGTPICFEDAFSWVGRQMVRQGADVLVNLTNNSWSLRDSAQTQHYLAAFLRSIETRTPLLRASNSGLTGIVDQKGDLIVGPIPYFKQGALRARIQVDRKRPLTPYIMFGDIWILLMAGFGLLPMAGYILSPSNRLDSAAKLR